MTTLQAIDQVRMILDEVGIEYYSNDAVLQALEQAQIEKALEYRNAGRKDLLVGLYRRKTLTGDLSTGLTLSVVTTDVPLTVEGLLCRLRATDPNPTSWARYIPPEEWSYYRFSNGDTNNRSPYLQFTYYGGKVWGNGAGTTSEFIYYATPFLPSAATPLSLSEPHSTIVDLAAKNLQAKEVIPRQVQEQMGAPERSSVGSFADLYAVQQSQQKQASQKDEGQ